MVEVHVYACVHSVFVHVALVWEYGCIQQFTLTLQKIAVQTSLIVVH